MMCRTRMPLAVATILTLSAQGRTPLFDFEDPDGITGWRLRTPQTDQLQQVGRFATSGRNSMLFKTPAWRQGMQQWPAFEVEPPIVDWRQYDRLVIDIAQPGPETHFLTLFISDDKVPFREGLSYTFHLPLVGFKRFVVPISSFPAAVDRSKISILHFYTQRPPADMVLYMDTIVLLRKGESVPEPTPAFFKQVTALFADSIRQARESVHICRQGVLNESGAPWARERAGKEFAAVEGRIRELEQECARGLLTLGRLDDMREELFELPQHTRRIVSVAHLRNAGADAGLGNDGMLVGLTSSMEKLLPRDMPFELRVERTVDLSLARNEKESFQIGVLADGRKLTGVTVATTDLRTGDGAVLPADNIDCDVVGYVQTRSRPPYDVSHIGWWPDPILDFLGPVDVAQGDLQSFWIRIKATKGQAPGLYRGKLTVRAVGVEPVQLNLLVKVRSFTLPDHTPLPTAITFFERKEQMGGEQNWDRMKHVYADFLADYYIDYDSLYRKGPPDFDILTRLREQGRLVAFNLGNVLNGGSTEEGFDEAIAETVARIRPAYDEAKRLGLLPYAYVYGFDERPKEQFPLLERSAQALRAAFPDVLLMTTSYDHSFGMDSVVKTIDAWCPLTPRFDPVKAEQARSQGRKVWWYICCGPRNPHANWFVEYAAIESRLLMGAMTAKYRPDGFLYYSLTIWNRNKPIESGPFTEWDPVSWTVYHGDGSMLCSGPGGKPVPTVRLENYRDGMEDFAYVCILEEIVRRLQARGGGVTPEQQRWLVEANAGLEVPESLVKTMAEYSRDPAQLYAYRNHLGDLIDRSGMPDADPWGRRFTVRGFEKR